jgi:glutaminase
VEVVERVDRLDATLSAINAEMAAAAERGKVADYIPSLAKVSPDHFGIAVVLANGTPCRRGR